MLFSNLSSIREINMIFILIIVIFWVCSWPTNLKSEMQTRSHNFWRYYYVLIIMRRKKKKRIKNKWTISWYSITLWCKHLSYSYFFKQQTEFTKTQISVIFEKRTTFILKRRKIPAALNIVLGQIINITELFISI
jgi:hypothetical protein